MESCRIVLLVLTISVTSLCNSLALLVLWRKKSGTTLKDSIISVLCAINFLRAVSDAMEVKMLVQGRQMERNCRVEMVVMSSLTYTSIGYYVQVCSQSSHLSSMILVSGSTLL